MSSIPENPKDQFAFFFDNPLAAGEPGGKGLIKGFYELLGIKDSSGKASMFAPPDLFGPAEMAAPSGEGGGKDGGGNGSGHHDGNGDGVGIALSLLGGLARGDLDI